MCGKEGMPVVESTGPRLAVARLEGPDAGGFCPAAGQPLQGYCMLNGESLTVYLEDGRGQTALLEGRLVWLEGGGAVILPGVWPPTPPALEGGAAAEAEAQGGPPAPMEPNGKPIPWADFLGLAGLPVTAESAAQPEAEAQAELAVLLEHHPAGDAPLDQEPHAAGGSEATAEEPGQEADPQVEPGPVPVAQAGAEPEPDGQPEPDNAVPEPEPDAGEEPSQVGFKLYPEPATPVSSAFSTVNVPLSSHHPLAPRAAGTAQLDLRTGRLAVHVRGLPTPAALGRDQATGRPLNAYRAWLVHQHTGRRVDLGLLTRVWGENFRLEADASLQLNRYDGLLVTAEDRTADTPDPASPQVLAGSYRAQ